MLIYIDQAGLLLRGKQRKERTAWNSTAEMDDRLDWAPD
jgi:hypothetical protein